MANSNSPSPNVHPSPCDTVCPGHEEFGSIIFAGGAQMPQASLGSGGVRPPPSPTTTV